MNIGQNKNRILYIDDFLAVFSKLPGEICQSWPGYPFFGGQTFNTKNPGDLTATDIERQNYVPEVFMDYLKKNAQRLPPSSCQCFNRLDRPVSGAVLLVFTPTIIPLLQNQFTANQVSKDRTVYKTYWAIAEGLIPSTPDFQLLEHYIRFDGKKQRALVSKTEGRKTKPARLLWRSLGCGEKYSFLEIQLLTGRTHQIRAQLADIGCHIRGDVKYGARRQDTLPGIRLHAAKLQFRHPLSSETISVEADLPLKDPLWAAFAKTYAASDSSDRGIQ